MTTPDHRFHRWIDPGERGVTKSVHKIDANEAERAAIAAWLDIPAVNRLEATLTLARRGGDTAAATGQFSADVDLVCGVSLDIFPETITGEVDTLFRKAATTARRPAASETGDIQINLDEDEPVEWTAQGVDLGALLAEELSLALPDFPRKPGVEGPEAVDPQDTEKPNPFAVLAKLKGQGGTGE